MKPILALPLLAVLASACSGGETDDTDDDLGGQPPQCSTSGYIAFDPANHSAQELRLGAFDDIVELIDDAAANPSLAGANFAEARSLYENTAIFREKVMTRVDEHFDTPPPVGVMLDQTLMDAFAEGGTATTAFAITFAGQKIAKTFEHFFFLSVYHEMVTGERKTWDEAFGYWGASSTNDDSTRRGLSAIATERDSANNTNLADTIFNGIVDGSCELAKALDASGGEIVDFTAAPRLVMIVDQIDLDMQKVLAYHAGHEALQMIDAQEQLPSDPEASQRLELELLELDLLFRPLEPLMLDRSIDSAARAGRIRTTIDAAASDRTGAWKTTFDPNAVITELEAEYDLDVRG